jgi:hypothetical protein
MKYILLLISVVTVLTTAGCIIPVERGGGDYRGHSGFRHHSEHRIYAEPGVDVHIGTQ